MDNYNNIILDLIGILLVGIIILADRGPKRNNEPAMQLLRRLLGCVFLIFLLDIPGLMLDGKSFSGARPLLWFLDSAYWLAQIIYCWLWLVFVVYWNCRSAEKLRLRRWLYALPLLLEIGLIFINPWTGWIFTLNEANLYTIGSAYQVNLLIYYGYMAASLLLALRVCLTCRDKEQKQRCLALLIYMFLPVCSVVLEFFAYGISWVWPFTALSLLMVYLNIQQQKAADERVQAALLDAELTQSRIAIMLSQIQPHFLYNSMNAITVLCDDDPQKAKAAMLEFSSYLRGNFDSLKQNAPLSFTTELHHIKTYLYLEKMRFEERLNVVFNIRTTDFLVPTLTIQPLVENAVKYGIGCREEGGTVVLSTRAEKDCFVVTVSDDGVGFDPNETQYDGRTHIGIDNVRNRLLVMCGATLEIKSEKNVGTTVTIRIPKECPGQ